MAVRIRLQRHGKKGRPFYYIVAADARSKRDGRYIERIGSYNPNTNPATIDLNNDKAVQWLQNGAEMSDTARAILSYRGVLYRHHLLRGVAKGALTEEQADQKYEAWLAEKEAKINANISNIQKGRDEERAERLSREKAYSDQRAAALAAAASPLAEEVAEGEEAPAAEAAEEAPAEEPAAEAEEAPAEEAPAEEPAAEAEEAPAEEESSDDDKKSEE